MKENNFFKTNVSEGIAAVKEGYYYILTIFTSHMQRKFYREFDAFIYDSVVLQYLSGIDNNCEIGTVGKWFSWTGYGIGFQKKSKWLNQVNKRILKYQENGS